jgi:hypothetical protein
MVAVGRPAVRAEVAAASDLRGPQKGVQVTTEPATEKLELGMTLVCPHCGISVVIIDIGDTRDETLTCHSTLISGRPVRCWRVYPQQADAPMVAGRVYVDEASGLTVRCTLSGNGGVRRGGRLLQDKAIRLPWRRIVVA